MSFQDIAWKKLEKISNRQKSCLRSNSTEVRITELIMQYSMQLGQYWQVISDMIGSAFIIRNASDYDDMFIADIKETEAQILNAKRVVKEIEKYLLEEAGLEKGQEK